MADNYDSILDNKYKIYTGLETKVDSSKKTSGIYKSFIINGKPYFEVLKLKEYNWMNTHGLTSKERKEIILNDPDYARAEETRSYRGPQGIAVAYLNHKTSIHKMDIHIQNQEDNEDSMKAVKSMFELELGVTLYPEGTEIEDPIFGLSQKLKSN